ncbi:unnamed protein product [Thelazia callipaeda]|uniref:CPG4 domain-containing protein n=1 Tax=Thelazia callipaeda TaxID=103827 RepID=A0A0N5CYK7_THECL|nr:unnamed protein product [Thelazia callipaeda]
MVLSIVKVIGQCAEQLQRCASITEEYERLIQESKRSAFRNCINKQVCTYELMLFEDCFEQSMRAIRMLSDQDETSISNDFGDSARRYINTVNNCFGSSQATTRLLNLLPSIINDDAIYDRTIYSIEYADHLWGLPQLIPTDPLLDKSATLSCLVKERTGRIFGNGINRFVDSADLKLNNLNNSCILEEKEMHCYRSHLSNNHFYQELLIDRDRIIRSCIRSVRLQTQCHVIDASRLRACLCSAREEFENRIQASILHCVKRSHKLHLREQQANMYRDISSPNAEQYCNVYSSSYKKI